MSLVMTRRSEAGLAEEAKRLVDGTRAVLPGASHQAMMNVLSAPRPEGETWREKVNDRELARADAELLANGAEAQHHVQQATRLGNEEVPARLGRVQNAGGLDLTAHCIAEVVLVLL